MLFLDLALRGGASMILILLAALLWRAPITWEGRLSVLTVALCKTAFLVLSSPVDLDLPAIVLVSVTLLASLTPNAITWLIVTIFIDPPFRRWPWLVASSVVSATFFAHNIGLLGPVICGSLAIALYAALFFLSVWSGRDDLLDCRCRARPGFAASIAGLALILTSAPLLGLLQEGSLTLGLLQSGSIAVVAIAFSIWILRPELSLWPGPSETPQRASQAPTTEADRSAAVDPALVQRVAAAMHAGVWREEGLTIGALATKLSVPEHRLRKAINQGLGFRNFSSFINQHRIAEAKAQLSNPEFYTKTVLEIAYEAGFASLGPFNRAFRAETGKSPTEYRRMVLDYPLADSEKPASFSAKLH